MMDEASDHPTTLVRCAFIHHAFIFFVRINDARDSLLTNVLFLSFPYDASGKALTLLLDLPSFD